MKWNWQHDNWPEFTFNAGALQNYEDRFIHRAGVLRGSMKHVDPEGKTTLLVELISEEAYKTSEIEGDILDRASLQSSIKKHFGLKDDGKAISLAEQGIADMSMDVFKSFDSKLSKAKLCTWHEMLTLGRRDLRDIGRYRRHTEPMQIVSGAFGKQKVHLEAPPSSRIGAEMKRFITWFNDSEKGNIRPLTRAGVAHLYFESIHPFEDGNGRIGRAICEKALSQSLNKPTLLALSHVISKDRKTYYEALQKNSFELEITDWLEYFCQIALRAQEHTENLIDFLIEKTRFFDRHTAQMNARQLKVINRMFKEGLDGFKGGLSADNYLRITGTSRATATRDLQDLVKNGVLIKKGERRYTRYYLNMRT